MKKIIKKVLSLCRDIFPEGYHWIKQKSWQAAWLKNSYQPSWLVSELPKDYQEAIEDQWFPAGSKVLDIGCGSGEISALLAQQGFTATGVDFAESAIIRARKKHGNCEGRLSFETKDILTPSREQNLFDIIVDRGCLHTMPAKFISRYVDNVASLARPNSHFLLSHKVSRNKQDFNSKANEEVISLLRKNFQPWFDIVRIEQIEFESNRNDAANHSVAVYGIALWMVRNSSAIALTY